jgi:hypothetical protein
MLNAGLLGGTRADVMAFAHGIIRLYYRIESYRFWKKEQAGAAVGDMLAFGIVAQSFAAGWSPALWYIPFSKLMVSVKETHGGNTSEVVVVGYTRIGHAQQARAAGCSSAY